MNTKMEVIICTLGTLGDILPFLELAKCLRSNNIYVSFMSNSNWCELLMDHVDNFVAIAPQDTPQSGRNEYNFFRDNTLNSYYKSFDYLEKRKSSTEFSAVIFRSNMKGCEYFCEKYGTSSVKLYLQPSSIKSFQRPPWPLSLLASSQFARPFKNLLIPLAYLGSAFFSRYRKDVDKFRLYCHLPSLKHKIYQHSVADEEIVLCPDWFALPQQDWPTNISCVGFVKLPNEKVDPFIDDFIKNNGKPIVFTPGTGVTDISGFFEKAKKICELLSAPGIFLSKELSCEFHQYGANILCLKFVDLGSILDKAKCIVHHGGIGTTYRALEASVPQVIIPNGYDQPDNAYRIAKLGFGAAVYDKSVTANSLANIIGQVLNAESIRKKLQYAARDISNSNAINDTCKIILKLVTHFQESK